MAEDDTPATDASTSPDELSNTEEVPNEAETAGWLPVARRRLLQGIGLAGLFGVGAELTSADPQGQVGTSTDPLKALYTQELNGGVTGGSSVTDLPGRGLAIGDGSLIADLTQVGSGTGVLAGVTASGIEYRSLTGTGTVSVSEDDGTITIFGADTDSDTRTNVSDDGSRVVANTEDINFSNGLNVNDDGDGSVTVDSLWRDPNPNQAGPLEPAGTGIANKSLHFATEGGRVTFEDRSGDPLNFVIPTGLPSDDGANVMINDDGMLVTELQLFSSARYKTNIQPLSTETEPVLDLEPRSFEYKENGRPDVGLIAEEVDDILPDLVNYDKKGRPNSVKYDRLGVYLIPEVRATRNRLTEVERTVEEQEARIDELEADLAAKDARIDDQRNRIDRLESTVDRIAELTSRLSTVESRLGLQARADSDEGQREP